MLFRLLHHPPRLDYLNLTLADIEGMEEELAIKLLEKLDVARESTIDANRAK